MVGFHLTVSLPSSRLEDIHTLSTANPAAIKAHSNEMYKWNPSYLAAMVNNPRMKIQLLQIYYPRFWSSVDRDRNPPLHLVAMFQIALLWFESWSKFTLLRWNLLIKTETLRSMLPQDFRAVWRSFKSWFLSVLLY